MTVTVTVTALFSLDSPLSVLDLSGRLLAALVRVLVASTRYPVIVAVAA